MSYPGDGGEANGLMPSAPEAQATAPQAAPPGLQPPDMNGQEEGGAAAGENDAGMMQHMTSQYDRQVEYYKKLREANERITVSRKAVDGLVSMKDMVTQQDVVEAASKLVSAGMGAEAIAGMLADMPPDGPALQGWLKQQDDELRMREQQLTQATQMVRFQMGTNALKLLATHAMQGTHLPKDNPLMGGAVQ